MSSTEWDVINALSLGLTQQVDKTDTKARVRALAPAVSALRADITTQQGAANTTDIPRLMAVARGLWDEIELITGTGPRRPWFQRLLENFSTGGVIGIIILLVAFGGVAYFMGAYIWKVDISELRTIEGSRPILTITAVLATIAFGGGLVFAALFSNEGAFENRFRMAREIFLVFSGVFATVVGFHFGKPDTPRSDFSNTVEQSKQPSKVAVLETIASEKDGKLVFAIKGGTPPFEVTGKLDDTAIGAKGASPLSIDLKGFDLSKEIGVLTIKLVDAANASNEIALQKIKLKGWSASLPAPTPPTKPSDQAASKAR